MTPKVSGKIACAPLSPSTAENTDLDVDGFLLHTADANEVIEDGLLIMSGSAYTAADASTYLTAAELATFFGDFGTSRTLKVGSAGDVAYVLVEGQAGNSTLAQVTGGTDTVIDAANITLIAHFNSMESEDMLAANFADFA